MSDYEALEVTDEMIGVQINDTGEKKRKTRFNFFRDLNFVDISVVSFLYTPGGPKRTRKRHYRFVNRAALSTL